MRGLRRRNALLCRDSLMDLDVCVDFCAESSVVGLYRRRSDDDSFRFLVRKGEYAPRRARLFGERWKSEDAAGGQTFNLVGIRGPCGGISDNPRGSLLFVKHAAFFLPLASKKDWFPQQQEREISQLCACGLGSDKSYGLMELCQGNDPRPLPPAYAIVRVPSQLPYRHSPNNEPTILPPKGRDPIRSEEGRSGPQPA